AGLLSGLLPVGEIASGPIGGTEWLALTNRCCRTIFTPLRGSKIAAKLWVGFQNIDIKTF
ncbi:MAG: hypothetical protein KGY61_11470, partial [Desulfobacterales bacterium]|nr:hypothetical protein [Desulfobacterales bacterium]